MREEGSGVVVILGDEPELATRGVRTRCAKPRFVWYPRAVAGAAVLALHLIVISPLVLGVAAHQKRSPNPQSAGFVEYASKGEESSAMILLDLSTLALSHESDSPEIEIDAEGILLEETKLALASQSPPLPSVLVVDEADLADTANKEAGDPAANAMLFGKYMSHVAARIERAWIRPRDELRSGQFDCRVRILQDRAGVVLGINFEKCDEETVWRESLRNAILKASPLSAPPEPWLFTETVRLGFTSAQFRKGLTPDYLYEMAESGPTASAQPSHAALLKTLLQSSETDADLELSIEGSEVTWKKAVTAPSR